MPFILHGVKKRQSAAIFQDFPAAEEKWSEDTFYSIWDPRRASGHIGNGSFRAGAPQVMYLVVLVDKQDTPSYPIQKLVVY